MHTKSFELEYAVLNNVMKHKKATITKATTKSAAHSSSKDGIKPPKTNPSTNELNGPEGPEPTRYGDWERNGRVSDF